MKKLVENLKIISPVFLLSIFYLAVTLKYQFFELPNNMYKTVYILAVIETAACAMLFFTVFNILNCKEEKTGANKSILFLLAAISVNFSVYILLFTNYGLKGSGLVSALSYLTESVFLIVFLKNKLNYKTRIKLICVLLEALSIGGGIYAAYLNEAGIIEPNTVKIILILYIAAFILEAYVFFKINKTDKFSDIIKKGIKNYLKLRTAQTAAGIAGCLLIADSAHEICTDIYIMLQLVTTLYLILKIKNYINSDYKDRNNLITEVNELKKELLKKEKEFEGFIEKSKQDEVKNETLANISHEFKTPVNVIYSAIQTQELIKDKSDIKEILKYNGIIKQNCYRLTRLINNFIDITRFSRNNIKGQFVCVNIVDVTEFLVNSVVPFAESKNHEIVFDTTDEEIYMKIDKEMFDRMILNLLSNSIKYSNRDGHISVMLTNCDKEVIISVKDDGIGMEEECLKNIFNVFERVDKSYSRNTEGSGLGLTIVKNIVDIHKGHIDIKSKKDIGTEITITLPKMINEENPHSEMGHRLEDRVYVKYEIEVEMSDIY